MCSCSMRSIAELGKIMHVANHVNLGFLFLFVCSDIAPREIHFIRYLQFLFVTCMHGRERQRKNAYEEVFRDSINSYTSP